MIVIILIVLDNIKAHLISTIKTKMLLHYHLLYLFCIFFIVSITIILYFRVFKLNNSKIEGFESSKVTCELPIYSSYSNIIFTNIIHFIHFMSTKNMKFVGIRKGDYQFMVLCASSLPYTNIEMIPENSTIVYNEDSDKTLFEYLFVNVYQKNIMNVKFIKDCRHYINKIENTFDRIANSIVQFQMNYVNTSQINKNAFLLLNLNAQFEEKFNQNILNKYVEQNNNLKLLLFANHNDVHKTLVETIFNAKLPVTPTGYTKLHLDQIICSSNDIQDKELLFIIENEIIDPLRTLLYFDFVNHCDYPKILKEFESQTLTKVSEVNNQKNNEIDNSLHFSNYVNNTLYANMIIVSWPILYKYELKMTELDFNTIEVYSDKFDDLLPISSPMTSTDFEKTNVPLQIGRYYINIDPKTHPRESFMTDIYYATETEFDSKTKLITKSILQNSIPFEIDSDNDQIIPFYNQGEVFKFHITSKLNRPLVARYTTETNKTISVSLKEGDRVFLNQKSMNTLLLNNPHIYSFLYNALQYNNTNFYHGFVKSDQLDVIYNIEDNDIFIEEESVTNDNKNKLYIEFGVVELRTKIINEPSAMCNNEDCAMCFEYNNDESEREPTNVNSKLLCEAEPNRVWDKQCSYNYECPFFMKNGNYKNFRGGCVNGFCEMPKGIHERTFRQYNETKSQNKPLCYNCPPEVNIVDCCAKQQSAIDNNFKQEYGAFSKKLVTPDYMFEDDIDERMATLHDHTDNLCNSDKQLYVNKYI